MEAEDYPGPTEKVDVILLINVLYYFNNYLELVQKWMGWLNTGGVLLASSVGKQRPLSEAICKAGFKLWLPDLHAVERSLRQAHPELKAKYLSITSEYDMTHFNKETLSILLMQPATQQEAEDVVECCPVDGDGMLRQEVEIGVYYI